MFALTRLMRVVSLIFNKNVENLTTIVGITVYTANYLTTIVFPYRKT